MTHWVYRSGSSEQTANLGHLLGTLLEAGAVIFLCGELGSGKTCLSQGIARGLGVPSEVAVTSPSYTLMNQYQGRLELNHFDLYRLGDPDELQELGFDHYLGGEGVSLVEWADRFDLNPGDYLRISLLHEAPEHRRLDFRAAGESHRRLLQQLVSRQEARGSRD